MDPELVLDGSSTLYYKMRSSIIEIEKNVLAELGFELYRISSDHPHKLMLSYMRNLKTSNEVARMAWNYLNDSFRTTICVRYPPSILAASCLYLAMRVLSFPMPKVTWWILMESSLDAIKNVCAEILYIYRQQKVTFKDIAHILEESFRNSKDIAFKFENPFEPEEQQVIVNNNHNLTDIKEKSTNSGLKLNNDVIIFHFFTSLMSFF